ncbi:hypothetical protein D3C80_1968000 [compost metagenome]
MFEFALVRLDFGDIREQRNVLYDVTPGIAHATDGLHFGINFSVFASVPDFTIPVALFGQAAPHGLVKLAGVTP